MLRDEVFYIFFLYFVPFSFAGSIARHYVEFVLFIFRPEAAQMCPECIKNTLDGLWMLFVVHAGAIPFLVRNTRS